MLTCTPSVAAVAQLSALLGKDPGRNWMGEEYWVRGRVVKVVVNADHCHIATVEVTESFDPNGPKVGATFEDLSDDGGIRVVYTYPTYSVGEVGVWQLVDLPDLKPRYLTRNRWRQRNQDRCDEAVQLARIYAASIAPFKPSLRPAVWTRFVAGQPRLIAEQAVTRIAEDRDKALERLRALTRLPGIPLTAQVYLDIAVSRFDGAEWGPSSERGRWMRGWFAPGHPPEDYPRALHRLFQSIGYHPTNLHQATAAELLSLAISERELPLAVREQAVKMAPIRGVAFDRLYDALTDAIASGESDKLRILAAQKLNDAAHPPRWAIGNVGVVFSEAQRNHLQRLLTLEPNKEVAFGLASALAPDR